MFRHRRETPSSSSQHMNQVNESTKNVESPQCSWFDWCGMVPAAWQRGLAVACLAPVCLVIWTFGIGPWLLLGPSQLQITVSKGNIAQGQVKASSCTHQARVVKLADLETSTVNHPPYTTRKKVLVKTGEIPPVMQLGCAFFKPDSYFPEHDHVSMFELFFVLNGTGVFRVTTLEMGSTEAKTIEIQASPFSLLHLPPGVQHSGKTDEGFQFLMLGVATDDTRCFKQARSAGKCPALSEFRYLSLNDVAQETMVANPKCMRRDLIGLGELPDFLTMAESTIPPYETLPIDSMYPDAYKVYYVLQGSGEFVLDDPSDHKQVEENSMVLIPPKLVQRRVIAGSDGLRLLYFAVAEDAKCK